MEKKDSIVTASDEALIKALTRLNEISARINHLGMGQDVRATLELIAISAVEVVAAGTGTPQSGEQASAVIWIYDEARHEFDLASRFSAGEPAGTSINDFPRPNGLGRRAIRLRRRLLSYEAGFPHIHPLKQAVGARVLVCYPLIVSSEIVGVLYVYRCDNRHFSEIELLILDNFVHLAGMAIYHGRQMGGLSQALSRKVRELEKLRRASHLISSRTNLNETLQEILAIGLDMTAAQYGSFEMYDKQQDLLIISALAGSNQPPSAGPPLPVNEQSVVGWVALHRESVLIEDLHTPPWPDIYQPLPGNQEMRSELAVPLIGAGGGLEGVLNIESPQPNAFTKEDQHLLEALATQATIAIQEIRLLDTMQEIVQVLLTAPLDELLKLIIVRACELINVASGAIWLVAEPDTLVLRQSTENQRLGEQISVSRSLTGQAIKLGQPLAIDNVRAHPYFQSHNLADEKGWVSALVVPLLAPHPHELPVGGFILYASHLRDFSEWDKKLLTCLANHAAVAIRDAEQLSRLKETQERQAIAETFAAVGDVGANLLHQLNNKFGAISARVQGIEDKCEEALESWPYLANNLQDISRSTRQAMQIVRDSMVPLRPLHAQPVEVVACVERALQRAKPDPAIKITRAGLDNLPKVLAGEQQLEMVIYNLLDNACKAMPNGGELRIEGRPQNREVAITVADNGPGIPADRQERIFEFGTAVEQSGKNLGFGLWWVKTFVDRFGGRVDVESEPGQGAAFTVWLPAGKEL